jgi:galactose mutarotase-like enzyme
VFGSLIHLQKLPVKKLEICIRVEIALLDTPSGVIHIELETDMVGALRYAADELDKSGFCLELTALQSLRQ